MILLSKWKGMRSLWHSIVVSHFKGKAAKKWDILSSFTHPNTILNLYDFVFCGTQQKKKISSMGFKIILDLTDLNCMDIIFK